MSVVLDGISKCPKQPDYHEDGPTSFEKVGVRREGSVSCHSRNHTPALSGALIHRTHKGVHEGDVTKA